MGKKINPKIFRMKISKTWPSKWFGLGRNYSNLVKEDVRLRKYITREMREAGIDAVEIERSANRVTINIRTAKPGIIIGRGGAGIEGLKKKIHDNYLKKNRLSEINVNIIEVDRPNLSAGIIVQSMVLDLEKRMPFRRVMKQAISRVERSGALGVKTIVKGRLNGAEIARSEMLVSGKVPLHTLRADIDYSRATANTNYGAIGVKVWIYRGDVFEKQETRGDVIGRQGAARARN